MKSISGKEFAKVLEQNEWVLLRIQGSHHIYGKSGVTDRISVPIHANKSLKTGLVRHFLKVARLSDDFQPILEADEDLEEN
ncbi:type II toxin-antitoxin system HicA family toxin [Leptolyngbyaceae cyanobacterium UHCC 1019]